MTSPVDALKRAISAPLIISPAEVDEAKNLFLLNHHITWHANLDSDTYDFRYLDVAMKAGVNFSVPSQELFTAAEKICVGFVQGFVQPRELHRLKILIRDEGTKMDGVLKKYGRTPEDYTCPLVDADFKVGTRLPDRYLKIITPYLNDYGHVDYPLKIREGIRHFMQISADQNRFTP